MDFFKSQKVKKFYAALLLIVFAFSVSVPLAAFALTGTIGSESPRITAAFTNSTGDVCDGNDLSAGEYNVKLMLSGMSYVSLFQLTADVTDDLAINSVSTVADTNSQFSVAGLQNEDNKFVVVIMSENDDTTAVSSKGEAMITLSVTVNTPGDFADYFVVSDDYDLTYIEADYGDGYELSYVVNTRPSDDVHIAKISVDMSPELTAATYDVTGRILIATDPECTATSEGIIGITVSVDGTDISAVTDKDGYYTLSGLEEGTYTLTMVGPTTIDRKVTLVVTADKTTLDAVPIVICDYNHDGYINSGDTALFGGYLASEEYYVYADISGDGYVNSADTSFYGGFFDKTITYQDVTL